MSDTIRVHTPAGTLTGIRTDQGARFAGIPFAKPPVGDLRFRPPQPIDDQPEIDSTEFKKAPAQAQGALGRRDPDAPRTPMTPTMQRLMAAMGARVDSSEDSLYLNVWTPDTTTRRPVVVWIYGGGFENGAATPPVTDGAALSRVTDTVVVTIAYRVGVLGWGYWADFGGPEWADAANLGLQDQIAGLQWVKRNIGSLGGDPDNITVAGESAGAFSIGTLLTLPAARGLFNKAILSSGSTRRIFPKAIAASMAADLAAAVGAKTMDDLQRVDVEALLAHQTEVIDSDLGLRNLPGGRSWGVVLDGTVVTEDPQAALAAGKANDIGLLTAANHDEVKMFQLMGGQAFAPNDEAALRAEIEKAGFTDPDATLANYTNDSPSLADARNRLLTDVIYRNPAIEMAEAQMNAGGRAWTYVFNGHPLGEQFGAFHAADLMYAFDALEAIGIDAPREHAIQDEIQAAWKQFAWTGDPGWPQFGTVGQLGD